MVVVPPKHPKMIIFRKPPYITCNLQRPRSRSWCQCHVTRLPSSSCRPRLFARTTCLQCRRSSSLIRGGALEPFPKTNNLNKKSPDWMVISLLRFVFRSQLIATKPLRSLSKKSCKIVAKMPLYNSGVGIRVLCAVIIFNVDPWFQITQLDLRIYYCFNKRVGWKVKPTIIAFVASIHVFFEHMWW